MTPGKRFSTSKHGIDSSSIWEDDNAIHFLRTKRPANHLNLLISTVPKAYRDPTAYRFVIDMASLKVWRMEQLNQQLRP
jgi:hypothetical protein